LLQGNFDDVIFMFWCYRVTKNMLQGNELNVTG